MLLRKAWLLLQLTRTHKGRGVFLERTICEVHRDITDRLVCRLHDRPEVLEEILPCVNEAYLMGARLVESLIEKKISLPEWTKTNIAEAAVLRTERNRLVKVLNEAGYNI